MNKSKKMNKNDQPSLKKIGAAVCAARERLGWSQRELARTIDTTPGAISHIERGLRGPSSEMIARIAGALGCSVDDLLGGVVSEDKKSIYMQRVIGAMEGMPLAVQEQVADYCEFLKQRKK